jgi:ABC-type multidrug transport system ATPase subunit
MALVSAICRYVYVLDFGRLIFEGTMAEAMSSDLVRDAYLGTGSPDVLSAAEVAGSQSVQEVAADA